MRITTVIDFGIGFSGWEEEGGGHHDFEFLDLIQYGKCSVNNSAGGRPARDIVRLKTGMQFGMDGLDMRRVGAVVMIFNMVFFASLNIIARFQKHAHRKVCTSNRERR